MPKIIRSGHHEILRDLIQHYGVMSTFYDPQIDCEITKIECRMPFRITRNTITLDYDRTRALNLVNFPTAIDEEYKPWEIVFRKIPFHVQHATTRKRDTNEGFIHNEAVERVLEKIHERLDIGYIEKPVYGTYSYDHGYQFPDPRPEIYESRVWSKSSIDTIQREIKCGIQKYELGGVIGEPLSIETADKVKFFTKEVEK